MKLSKSLVSLVSWRIAIQMIICAIVTYVLIIAELHFGPLSESEKTLSLANVVTVAIIVVCGSFAIKKFLQK